MPQRRRASAHQRLLDQVNPGDEVMTVGGLIGRVVRIDEDELALEVSRGVEVRVAKRAVATVLPPEDTGSSAAT